MYLKAKYVINAGGQWNLYERDNVVEKYYFLNKNKDDNIYSKWFDLNKQLENNNTPILYLFGARNEIDIEQIKCAERIKNVYPIGINSNAHAQSVSTESYLHLLLAEWEDIYKIFLMDKHNIIKISELEEQINSYIELPTNMTMDITKTREQQKQEAYLELLYEWVEMEQNGKETKKYLDDLRTVAIWGKGKCCDLLINDLKARGNEVVCIIESNPLVEEYKELPVISIEDLPNNVDTIIIVPYYDSVEIKEKIKCRPDVKVIGIDEFIKR